MPAWEYRSDLVVPGNSVFATLEELGPAGWEAWHIEPMADGWQRIYSKRPVYANDPRQRAVAAELLEAMERIRVPD